MNSATESRDDNDAEQGSTDQRRGLKLVPRNEGQKTRRALGIGIPPDLFSCPGNRVDKPSTSDTEATQVDTGVQDNPLLTRNLLDVNRDRLLNLAERPKAAIYVAVATGLIVGFLIGRRL